MAEQAIEDVERVADELYGLPASEFVAARDDRAQQARAQGDRETAAAIRKLRRPSTSAWLANMFVRHRPDDVADLTQLGDALRAAQAGLAGEDIRRLGEQRRRLVDRLLPEARALADELGHPVGDGVLREFEGTLQAALADADAADAFTAGRLTTALQADTGFGFGLGVGEQPQPASSSPVKSSSARSGPATGATAERKRDRARGDRAAKTVDRDAERLARARAEVDEARSAVEDAERAADERRESAASVATELTAATDKLDELLAAVDETRRAKADAERRHRVAQRRADQAAHGVKEARRRLDQAERRLADLTD